MAVAAAGFVLVWLTVLTWLIAQRMHSMLARSEHERQSLAASTAPMARRNEQFSALYETAVENADETDAAEIAIAAAASARRLLRRDLAVLWLSRAGELVLAATDVENPYFREGTALNPALAMRVAAHGRSLIVRAGAEADLHGSGIEGAGSGVFVPLILRSKIVGVLGC